MKAVLMLELSASAPTLPVMPRRSRAQGRARRWDAGPAPTARDLAALRFIGEQYAVRADVAGVLLTRLSTTGPEMGSQLSRRAVREQLGRWQQAGWAERRRLLGHTWITPTHAGLRLVGLDYDPWSPVLDRLDHHHAVAVVRLAREPVPGPGGWVCERALWRRRGKASWHLADAALPVSVPQAWRQQGISQAWELVEVELTQKARRRVLAALKTRPPHTAHITYYVPPELHAAVSAQLASVVGELGGRPPVAVELLPTLAALTAGGAAA
jgi:hypothetical protein